MGTACFGKSPVMDWSKVLTFTVHSISFVQKKSSFIAVGAGHLPGKDGLLELLR